MKTVKAYRYEIKPNVRERILLAKHAGAARFAYNWGLKQRIDFYEKDKTSTNAIEQHRVLNSLKTQEFPWMYEVSKCAPQEALRDLEKAFQNFYRGLKQGKQVGFPKFKKKGKRDSFRLTGTIKVNSRTVQLPRLGILRLKESTHVEGKILSATISREADRWYVSITLEEEIESPLPICGDPIGIDLGLTSFLTTSDGNKITPPKPLNKALKKLKRLSKKHSRKKLGSNNRKKSAFSLARHHRKIGNKRRDFLHKLSTTLTKTKSAIVVEDLDVKEMLQKKSLNRHIADVGWTGFIQMLEYKAKWYGSCLKKAPRYFASTKTCSSCGHIKEKLALHTRQWVCNCGVKHDRDINAAINLLKLHTGSSPGIYACEDTSGSGTGNWSTSHVSLKQEVTNGIFVHKL
jgi:putative transposase